jgi:hypothetical protein
MAGRRFDRRTLLTAIPLALGLALVVGGFLAARSGEDSAGVDNPAIEQLYPADGALVLRQSEVGIDLAPGYTGELAIDGQALPTQRLESLSGPVPVTVEPILVTRYDPGSNTLLYLPQEGAPIEEFDAGQHTVTATYWREVDGPEAAKQYSWTFRVS